MAAGAPSEQRERLVLEDFETKDEAFDPVMWLNARLATSGVKLDKLDQHLSSLGMSCQLLCQDTSEAIEVASNQLVAQLPSTGLDLERMRAEALRGKSRLGQMLEGLKDADDRKRSGLQGLAEIDAVKTRVEVACSALREVGSWERKVRDCEQMVHSGNLPAALGQLKSLKGVLDAFRMLPEYSKKESQLSELEEQLLSTARRRARLAVERNSAEDLRACREVFAGMQRHSESASIANAVFLELSERAWKGQDPGKDSSATEIASAVRAVFDVLAQALEERWPLLQALELPDAPDAGEEATPSSPSASTSASTVTVVAVKAALGSLSLKLEECIPESRDDLQADLAAESSSGPTAAHARASRAVALLAVYVDGFAALAASKPLAGPGRWHEVCRPSHLGDILPWVLLREVARFVLLQPMQDDAAALSPPVHGQLRPSEAVLTAESNATRLLLMPATWARRLEQQGAAQLAAVWLACVDESTASHWHQWVRLTATFHNTLKLKTSHEVSDGSCSHDPALLQECMQLHSILHDSLPAKFANFQADALQLAVQLRTTEPGSAINIALQEKMKDPEVWCSKLGIPSTSSLRSTIVVLDGTSGDPASIAARASQALPASLSALANVEKQVRTLVTQCCAQPVSHVLRGYPEMQEWTRRDDNAGAEDSPVAGPLQCITSVGEHLFSLVPQLERSQDSSQPQWLPIILEAVAEAAVQKALQIKHLTPLGAQQLNVDLEYLRKVTDALGSSTGGASFATSATEDSSSGATKLQELLEALEFLSSQQHRKQGCALSGGVFTEDLREGPPLNRLAERAFRAAMGL